MTTQALQKNDPERAVEFIPYGAADKIKLSVRIIQNIVAVPTKSGQNCSERDALRFLMLCQAQRLNPFAGDAFLVGYDGRNGPSFSLITAHQAFLKRAETCPDYEGMESGVIILADDGTVTEREGDFYLEGENVVGGWARVHRKGRKDTYRRIRMSRFNKGFAQWQDDAAGMIVKCAEADALRSTFPTLLGGLYLQGEMEGAATRIVQDMATTRPLFEARPLPTKPQLPVASDDDGDLGPQTQTSNTQPLQPPSQPEKQPGASESERQVTTDRTQAPAADPNVTQATAPAKEAPKANLVKAIKGLLNLSRHTEPELMSWLATIGKVDDSIGTLKDANEVSRDVLQWCHDNWQQVDKELKTFKAAK